MLFLGVLLPCIPAIIALVIGGYISRDEVSFLCTPREIETAFYTLLLPISIILATGVTLLLILTWNIIKVHA